MQLKDYDYCLPEGLIAKHPLPDRPASRMLVVDRAGGGVADQHFYDLADLLKPGDLLVINNTRVIPARVYGHKRSGGKIEMLVERVLSDTHALCHIKASKAPKAGSELVLAGDVHVSVLERQGDLFVIALSPNPSPTSGRGELIQYLEHYGEMPLPPYIDRPTEEADKQRYQTVYAQHDGSVAAPTAGLHFDDALLEKLRAKNIDTCEVTLHVGAGTFQPVRVENIKDHIMHAEYLTVDETICEKIKTTKEKGGRVIAVGTTSCRALETAAKDGEIKPFNGDTQLFIYPGFEFNCIDGLITNFHLPKSSLLMLVSAFAGRETMFAAYEHAIQNKYRFFSYGDAMLIV